MYEYGRVYEERGLEVLIYVNALVAEVIILLGVFTVCCFLLAGEIRH